MLHSYTLRSSGHRAVSSPRPTATLLGVGDISHLRELLERPRRLWEQPQ
jgi:hypothetical protein